MKLSELQQIYGNVELDENILDELVKYLIAPSWVGKDNRYFAIQDDGIVREHVYEGDGADFTNIEMGNFFQTKEEAEFEVERRKIETEMLRLGGTRDFWSIGDEEVEKYYVNYSYYRNLVYVSFNSVHHKAGIIYFPTEELAQKVIEKIGRDRLKKYLFYVKD